MKLVSWSEYTELLNKLYEAVRAQTFDDIVAIGRGGSIIAAYLGSKLGVPTFVPIFVRHVKEGKGVKLVTHGKCDVTSLTGRLLVVDDSMVQGRAMRFVLDMLPKKASVKTLVMYCSEKSKFKPDFVGAYFREDEHEIVFPYETP
jgi:hypoxanthine phosphoribosyltransferase